MHCKVVWGDKSHTPEDNGIHTSPMLATLSSTQYTHHRHSTQYTHHRHSTQYIHHRHSTKTPHHRHSTKTPHHRHSTKNPHHRHSTKNPHHRHSTQYAADQSSKSIVETLLPISPHEVYQKSILTNLETIFFLWYRPESTSISILGHWKAIPQFARNIQMQ